jgi:cytoskeletal protein RodZ
MWWIWVLVVVVVLALGVWLFAVRLAANRPGSKKTMQTEPRRGQVQGGSHVGGGRSVGPRRDAEVTPGQDPESPTVPVRESGGNSPMDL